MDASKCTIHHIFNGYRILEIPFFQRAYVWKKDQWQRFLADMETVTKDNRPYFIGSIILKQQPTQTGSKDRRTVIDGQQRLTTLAIFLKVLSLKINNPIIVSMLKIAAQNNVIALHHNHIDYPAFNRIMNLEKPVFLDQTDAISEAFNFFLKKMDVDKVSYESLFDNIMFIAIDLQREEDEQQIFDTINSLGVKLTTGELLKNYLFSRNEYELFEHYWQPIFEPDKKTKDFWDIELVTGRIKRNLIDVFFHSFLQIKIQDPELGVNTEHKLEFKRVEGLFSSYKSLIEEYEIDKQLLLQEIREYAEVFKNSINVKIGEKELQRNNQLDRINLIMFGLETTTLISYVLFILKNAQKEEQSKILTYLEAYIMRRLVCHENTKNYNQLFSERLISPEALTKDGVKSLIENQSDTINYMPSNNDIKKGFHDSRLVNNQSAGILYMIESQVRNTNFHSTSLLGFDNYSLEHIMPKKWRNYWDIQDFNETMKAERDKKLLTLGNLSILTSSLNASVKDAPWVKKVSGNKKNSGLKAYASGLETISKYLDRPKWDEDDITERADFLYEHAINCWKI